MVVWALSAWRNALLAWWTGVAFEVYIDLRVELVIVVLLLMGRLLTWLECLELLIVGVTKLTTLICASGRSHGRHSSRIVVLLPNSYC